MKKKAQLLELSKKKKKKEKAKNSTNCIYQNKYYVTCFQYILCQYIVYVGRNVRRNKSSNNLVTKSELQERKLHEGI